VALRPAAERNGPHAGHHRQRGEAVRNGHASAQCPSRNLGALPLNRKSDWRAADDPEIVAIVGVLPDVLTVDHEVLAECLLEPGVEFIPHPYGSVWMRERPINFPV
jgi:hypothetical protein